MSPKLRGILARVVLVGGVALVASLVSRAAPKEQTLAIALESRQVRRIEGVVTRQGDAEPTAGFSQDFPTASPRVVRHTFSAPDDTYIVVITLHDAAREADARALAPLGRGSAGEDRPIPSETSFERRVSLAGGEVIVSPD